jgi:hypothetical protein
MPVDRRAFISGVAAAACSLRSARSAARGSSFDVSASVRSLAAATREEYHDPKLADEIADRLISALRAGTFRASSPDQLVELLNREISVASHDAHFMVMAGQMADMRAVPPTEPHAQTAPLNPSELAYLKRINFGIGSVQILRGNVGRLAIRDQFYRPAAEVCQRYALAMSLLADTDALIVDLTETIGGDPNSVALVLSYFFDRPEFVVNRFHWRKLPVQEFRTTRNPGGPLYGEQRPVAVLVSNSSFSAAEEFAYDVKASARGLIVGVRTPGAANHALPVPIAGGFTAFIPKARAENPLTHGNWEGVGVTPDVIADPPSVEAARAALISRLGKRD